MESYSHYLRTKKNTKDASSWMANKDKTDSQDRQPYTLAKIVFQAEYCGQASAGAPNYHKSPESFNTAMQAVIREEFSRLSKMALERLQAVENEALVACRGDRQEVLAQIDAVEAPL